MTFCTLYQTILDDDGETVESARWHADNIRDGIADVSKTRTCGVGGVEYTGANWSSWNSTLHITVQNAMEYRTGHREERTLCIPGITHASARRLSNLLRCQWSA